MNFCKECNNLLYPRENRAERRLYYACRNCDYQEPAMRTARGCEHGAGSENEEAVCEACSSRVYVNQIKQSLTANLNISRDTTLDPALKRTRAVVCAKCGNNEACFFARSDERMELVFVCTRPECAYHWTQNKEKEDEKK